MPVLRSRASTPAPNRRTKTLNQSSPPPPIEPATPSITDATSSGAILESSPSVMATGRRRSLRFAAMAVTPLSNDFETPPPSAAAMRGFRSEGEGKVRVLDLGVEGNGSDGKELGHVGGSVGMRLRSGLKIARQVAEKLHGDRKLRGKRKAESTLKLGNEEIGSVGQEKLVEEFVDSEMENSDNDDMAIEMKGRGRRRRLGNDGSDAGNSGVVKVSSEVESCMYEEGGSVSREKLLEMENSDIDDVAIETRERGRRRRLGNSGSDAGKGGDVKVKSEIESCKYEEGGVCSEVQGEMLAVSCVFVKDQSLLGKSKRGAIKGQRVVRRCVRNRKGKEMDSEVNLHMLREDDEEMVVDSGIGVNDQSLSLVTELDVDWEQEEAGDQQSNLRSGSRITRRVMANSRDCVTGSKGHQLKGKMVLECQSVDWPEVDKQNLTDGQKGTSATDDAGASKISTRSKGKNKLDEKEGVSYDQTMNGMDLDNAADNVQANSVNDDGSERKTILGSRREAERIKAIELAPKFAFFQSEEHGDQEEADESQEELVEDAALEDWPGPFSTAMKIIEEREEKLRARENSSKKEETNTLKIPWVPSEGKRTRPLARQPLTLKELCLNVLANNAEEIESLEGVPDVLKHKLISMLCCSRKMSVRLLNHLVSRSPAEINLSDCSWANEDEFEDILSQCNLESLKVLQLSMCGRCMPDYIIKATVAKSPSCLPSLTTLSLEAAYRLSDSGLEAIVSSAPFLSSVNISKCSLLTSSGIVNLADKLNSVLKELYIDNCINVDPMMILPALQNVQYLEVLSMAGIQTVSDIFVRRLVSVRGVNMRKLIFARCQKLTNASIRAIAENCSSLCAVDIQELCRLDDRAIAQLANGCRSIQSLKLRHNKFSDEAIAAFLEASGRSLIELSLNNVQKVAQNTALALSRRCSINLERLDLSFCRKMTDEALGLIVDSCSNLKTLKIFGCTQVTSLFLNGHSNDVVRIIGADGKILDGVNISGCF